MHIKFSEESIPCNHNNHHLLNTYFYHAEALPSLIIATLLYWELTNMTGAILSTLQIVTHSFITKLPYRGGDYLCFHVSLEGLERWRNLPKDTQLVIEPKSESSQSSPKTCALSPYILLLFQYCIISFNPCDTFLRCYYLPWNDKEIEAQRVSIQ